MVTGQDIIKSMQKYGDTPYFEGNPQVPGPHGGLDCSGIVQLGLHDLGISVSRTTGSQLADSGKGIGQNIGTDISKAQPGDIIHYNGHEEVYLGNGREWGEHQTGVPAGEDSVAAAAKSLGGIVGIVRYTADPGTPGSGGSSGGGETGMFAGLGTLIAGDGKKIGLIIGGGLMLVVGLLVAFQHTAPVQQAARASKTVAKVAGVALV